MARILITGVAGLLGSHLADKCLAEGHEVIGVDNLVGGDLTNVSKGVQFYQVDCGDRAKMYEIMEGVDIVYHAACTAHEGLSIFSPDYITRNTFGITMSVLSAALDRKVKRFIYLSSMARYGTHGNIDFTEDMTPKPQDPYAISKHASELVVKLLGDLHGMEWVIAIPHSIIGPRQKYDDPYRNVAAIFINLMLQGKTPVVYGDGEQKRCFSFVGDVVDPLYNMAFYPVAGETINIGPDENPITVNKLVEEIASIIGCLPDLKRIGERPSEVKVALCSADKSRKLLGYTTKTDYRDGLKAMVDYIKEHGTKEFDWEVAPLEINNDLVPTTWKEKKF